MDPNMFFPERGDLEAIDAARVVCERCPVRFQCASFGLWERMGVWGGTTEKDRRRTRRRLKEKAS